MRRIAALAGDLFFAARIESVLVAAGVAVEPLEAGTDALARLRESPPDALVLDLGVAPPLRDAVLAWARGRLPVFAFGSHVDTEALAAARRAGCAAVTTNGRLAPDLAAFVRSPGAGPAATDRQAAPTGQIPDGVARPDDGGAAAPAADADHARG